MNNNTIAGWTIGKDGRVRNYVMCSVCKGGSFPWIHKRLLVKKNGKRVHMTRAGKLRHQILTRKNE